jgi:hypothetical protein
MRRLGLALVVTTLFSSRAVHAGSQASQSLTFRVDPCLTFELHSAFISFEVLTIPNGGVGADVKATQYDFVSNIQPNYSKIVVQLSSDMPLGTALLITGGQAPGDQKTQAQLGEVTGTARDIVWNIPPSNVVGYSIEYTFSVTPQATPSLFTRTIQYTVMAQ